MKKTKVLEENKNYICQAEIPDITFPDVWKLTESYIHKYVDLSNTIASIMKLNNKEYKSCLHFNMVHVGSSNEESSQCWLVTLHHGSLSIDLNSFDNVDFFFNKEHYVTINNSNSKYLYDTKKHALIHLELKFIVAYQPSKLLSWMHFGGKQIHRIITPGLLNAKYKMKRTEKMHNKNSLNSFPDG